MKRLGPVACVLVVAAAVMGRGGSHDFEYDGLVSYNGETCTTNLPPSLPSGRLSLEVANGSAASIDFLIGTYDRGYGREDLLRESARLRPSFVTNVGGTSVGPQNRERAAVDLEAGRYYAVCLVDSPARLIVLPDLVVTLP